MKIILIGGEHLRHYYYMNSLLETGLVCGAVIQRREEMVSEPQMDLDSHMRTLYEHHFKLRLEMEEKYFGNVERERLVKSVATLIVTKEELNGPKVEEFCRGLNADAMFSYGPGLIANNILDTVGGKAFNLHGGLSPWYKGAATMFWPFYFLEPNYVGTTLHYITSKIDGGNIIHHSVPKLEKGDCMHEVACKAIVSASDDVARIVSRMNKGDWSEGVQQKKNGKLFLVKDWRPEHMRLIYDLYEDKIVDLYLNGEISRNNEPKLISYFN